MYKISISFPNSNILILTNINILKCGLKIYLVTLKNNDTCFHIKIYDIVFLLIYKFHGIL